MRALCSNGVNDLRVETVADPEILKELTAERGPDSCIDAVGMEADGTGSKRPMTA